MSRHNVSEEGHIPGERKVIGTPHPLLQQSRPTTHLPQILSPATGNVPANSAPRESSTREKSKLGHRSGAPSRGTELEAGPPSRALKRTFLAWPSSSEDFQLLNAFLPSSNSAAPTHLEVSRHGSLLSTRGRSLATSRSPATETAARVSPNRVKVFHTHPESLSGCQPRSLQGVLHRCRTHPLSYYALAELQAAPARSRYCRSQERRGSLQLPLLRRAIGSRRTHSKRVKKEGAGPGGGGKQGAWPGGAGREGKSRASTTVC